ncbi:MAG: stage V sporulation protein D [Ruminococcaceae bacterium]|nr:stage V sporulation protein D [Oscillospiraceae bacterium]
MKEQSPKRKLRIRIFIMCAVFSAFFALLFLRLAYIQLIDGPKLQKLALEQQTRDSAVASKRGTIYDRNGKVLAKSSSVYTVTANPNEIRKAKKDVNEIAEKLSDALGMDDEKIEELLKREVNHVVIKRKIEEEESNKVRALELPGIILQEDAKRYYPYGNFASHVIGFTGDDNQGLGGIEMVYDEELKGVPGRVVALKNALDSDMPFKEETHVDPEDGINVVLTLDETVQHFAEKHLETAYLEEKTLQGASAIVMDVDTGEILAMTTKPDFDLNNPFELIDEAEKERISAIADDKERVAELSNALQSMWRNKAVVDSYEPGSCFKIVTACMALEEGVINENSTYYCPGYKQVESHRIHCAKREGHGMQNLADAVKNSCNPAFIEIGMSVGNDTFRKYYEAFGFLDVTGFDIPGEANGVFYAKDNFNIVELATASFGQGPKVTPLQMITAVSAVANGGKLMKPYLVKELVDDNGNVISATEPTIVRQVISESTSEKMCSMLENVVANGGGSNAYVKGFRVAGKTGTSEKIPRGSQKYIASFIGFAPANDPKVCCLVMLDEPSNGEYYGGRIAAPVVGRILEDTLNYLNVEPQYTEQERQSLDIFVPDTKGLSQANAIKNLTSEGLKYTVVGSGETVINQMPKGGSMVPGGSVVVLYTEDVATRKVIVPDVTNMSVSQARAKLAESRLNINISGVTGGSNSSTPNISVKQSIMPGVTVEEGTIVEVEFRYLNMD